MEQTDSVRGKEGRGDPLKEGKGISPTYVKGPWTWAMVRGLTMEVGADWAEGGKGENWDNCNNTNNKTLFLKN